MEDKGWPFLRVSWEPPHKADTRSGWITLIYELRIKLEGENDWEVRYWCQGVAWWLKCFSLKCEFKPHVSERVIEPDTE